MFLPMLTVISACDITRHQDGDGTDVATNGGPPTAPVGSSVSEPKSRLAPDTRAKASPLKVTVPERTHSVEDPMLAWTDYNVYPANNAIVLQGAAKGPIGDHTSKAQAQKGHYTRRGLRGLRTTSLAKVNKRTSNAGGGGRRGKRSCHFRAG